MNSILGYSPYNAPYNGTPIFPFDELFDGYTNLRYADSLDKVSAIVIWGGTDISPALYNEPKTLNNYGPINPSDRDLFEWMLMKEALEKKKPIIGVCRGAQMLCALAGGKLAQDIQGHNCGQHQITTYDGNEFSVTSAHHQMMYHSDIEHMLLAWSTGKRSDRYEGLTDNEISKLGGIEPEVVYFPEVNGMAIQGHPEWMTKSEPFVPWILEQIADLQFK